METGFQSVKRISLMNTVMATLVLLTLNKASDQLFAFAMRSTDTEQAYARDSPVGPANDNWSVFSRHSQARVVDGRVKPANSVVRKTEAARRVISVTINKGECYVIDSLKTDATPRVKVVNNPYSLVVHTEAPGQVVMVGADGGSWNFDVTLASGEKVTYAVTIKALAPPQGSLVPVSAPTAIP
jgi:hypothetical protein